MHQLKVHHPGADIPAQLDPAIEAATGEAKGWAAGERTATALEPLAVGREQVASLFSISLATLARWDASGQLGPMGIRKNGRKLWLLAELRQWTTLGMPERKEWLALKQAGKCKGRQ
jgi:hypothetical protein